MTFLKFRRRRNPDGRKPAFLDDFPDDDRAVTEILGPPGTWGGASSIGLPDPDPGPAETYRRAIAQANTEARLLPAPPPSRSLDEIAADIHALPKTSRHLGELQAEWTARLREGMDDAERVGRYYPLYPPRAPAIAPPPGPDPRPAPQQPAPPPPPGPRDTGPMQRLPRITRVRERPRPSRTPDEAIFIWSGLLAQHIMLCGVCLRSRYADPIAAQMPFAFESLRQSAWVSGWRLDTFTRWACPACQQTPAYHSPRPVTHSHPELRRLRKAGKPVNEPVARAVLGNDPYGEFAARAAAEWDLVAAAAAAANHGKHAAVTP